MKKKGIPARILLLSPQRKKKINILYGFPILTIKNIGLMNLANLTPAKYKVEVKNVSQYHKPENVLLVGISVLTHSSDIAWDLGQKYKAKGIPVILGGIHVTLAPNEAIKYADSIVIGEAEGIWIEILDDFEKDQLKKIYQSTKDVNLDRILPLNFNYGAKLNFLNNFIQTSRGCPNKCSFCCISKVF